MTRRATGTSRREPSQGWVRRAGLFAGPVAAGLLWAALPDTYSAVDGGRVALEPSARMTLAVMGWMAVWWLSEAIEISATALLPLVLFPLLGVADIEQAAAPYASDLIFLFFGGFVLALSMQRWGLDRRMALGIVQAVGTRQTNMVGGFMLATALLSAFVSNTATTAMMLPIGLSVLAVVERDPAERQGRFALCLMLAIAYAASIGGLATIIGSPPNGIVVQFVQDQIAEPYRRSVAFVEWMAVGVPLAAVFLPLSWWLLTRVLYPVSREEIPGGRELLAEQRAALGRLNRGEWNTGVVFGLTALLWVCRPLLADITLAWGPRTFMPFAGLSDAGVAMLAAVALFAIPVDLRAHEFTMNWNRMRELPWGVLLLFGGGLSLAQAIRQTGVAEFLGAQAVGLGGVPPLVMIVAVAAMVIFLTELTSNTATTAALVPVFAAMAPGMGTHPYALILPAALGASCAFMMPVATPPNAIVFGSGHVTIRDMARAGLWLNLIAIGLVSALAYLVVFRLL